LGLSASTYDYYEGSRVPPADVLLKISRIARVDLRWLLTGEGSRTESTSTADHPAVRRAAELLAAHPDAGPALASFLDILQAAMGFPAKEAALAGRGENAEAMARAAASRIAFPTARPQRSAPTPVTSADQARISWIPVLGRTAAGLPHFWADKDEAATVTTLQEIVSRHAAQSVQAAPAAAEAIAPAQAESGAVQRVVLPSPGADNVCEFVAAERLKARHHDAFALRIDGDSMAPEFLHGDLVVLSPSIPAEEGKPAVVQLRNQIGVTCKLFRGCGGQVHLVPVNEQYPVQEFPRRAVVWALQVLARVR
jgi:SOS-response transcriptional repressor LexA